MNPLSEAVSTNPHTPIAKGFGLSGVSNHPDPLTHAYRKDLADTALAGRVIASHYAEPMARALTRDGTLYVAADTGGEVLAELKAGDPFRMLDNSRGWAWGYAPNGRVGYLESGAFTR